MADEERTGSCVCCQLRNPQPDQGVVCGPCRSRVAGQLRDIPALVAELRDPPGADPANDAVSTLLPAAAIAGQSSAPRVNGSREAPVPISVDRVDLLSAARVPSLTRAYAGQLDDQVGYQPAATILDGWCRMFAEERRESTPNPDVQTQCKWLSDRLDELFKHPAVDEFAGELGDLWHVLRRACGLTMPKPEICWGVQCRDENCSYTNTLIRLPGSEWIECTECGLLLSEDEYKAWIKLLAAAEGTKA